MEFITTNGRIMKDGVSSAKFTGISNGKKIVVYNCHLGLPPFGGFRIPCLFGTMEEIDGIYHYKKAFIINMGRGLHKIITC